MSASSSLAALVLALLFWAPMASAGADHAVNIVTPGVPGRFDPPVITAQDGDTVTFRNAAGGDHWPLSDDGGACFDAGRIQVGRSARVVIAGCATQQGIIAYHCLLHTMMKGYIAIAP